MPFLYGYPSAVTCGECGYHVTQQVPVERGAFYALVRCVNFRCSEYNQDVKLHAAKYFCDRVGASDRTG